MTTLQEEGSENKYGHFSHYHCRRPRANPTTEVAVSSVAHSACPAQLCTQHAGHPPPPLGCEHHDDGAGSHPQHTVGPQWGKGRRERGTSVGGLSPEPQQAPPGTHSGRPCGSRGHLRMRQRQHHGAQPAAHCTEHGAHQNRALATRVDTCFHLPLSWCPCARHTNHMW